MLRRIVRSMKSLQERRAEMQLKRQEEQFKKMIEDLSKKDTFTLKDFKKEISDHIKQTSSGIKKLWAGSQPEEAQLILQRKILNAIKEEELVDPQLITTETKQEISQVVQCSVEDVNSTLRMFRVQKSLHQYLKARNERGDYLPTNNEELHSMLMTDRPPRTKEQKIGKQPRFSKAQMRYLGYKF